MFQHIARENYAEAIALKTKKSDWCDYREGTEQYAFAWLLRSFSFREDNECRILKSILSVCGMTEIDVDEQSEKAKDIWEQTNTASHPAYRLRKDQIYHAVRLLDKVDKEVFFGCFPVKQG